MFQAQGSPEEPEGRNQALRSTARLKTPNSSWSGLGPGLPRGGYACSWDAALGPGFLTFTTFVTFVTFCDSVNFAIPSLSAPSRRPGMTTFAHLCHFLSLPARIKA